MQQHAHPATLTHPAAAAGEFLSFRLGAEHYAIEILKVQEIRGYDTPTAIAGAPAFIRGVVDLRGVIVPVLDLRIRFGLPHAACDAFTVTIILRVADRVVGIVVDAVSDVLTLATGDIRARPGFASSVFDASHITGLAEAGGRLLVLLDIEKLLASADLALADAAVH
jgi:purine-binding chemotaxis protein CheW